LAAMTVDTIPLKLNVVFSSGAIRWTDTLHKMDYYTRINVMNSNLETEMSVDVFLQSVEQGFKKSVPFNNLEILLHKQQEDLYL